MKVVMEGGGSCWKRRQLASLFLCVFIPSDRRVEGGGGEQNGKGKLTPSLCAFQRLYKTQPMAATAASTRMVMMIAPAVPTIFGLLRPIRRLCFQGSVPAARGRR